MKMKNQAPNPKHQASNKHQIPSTEPQTFGMALFLRFWFLEFIWDLEFGIWNF
jgi:hypothetical protein